VRYFGQTPDYWLDTCTLDEWTRIWSRELTESPPVDDWAAAYFKHKPDHPATAADDVDDAGEWVSELPDETE
jgi:hypothetical protein